jgi:monothiol glutaredoxin
MNINEIIEKQIKENTILLYMKGNKEMPMCGFSAKAVNLLKSCDAEFTTIDVLKDESIREGIKQFSNWPTIPQLYVKGEFIGGSDIMTEMYEAGELQEIIK